MPLVDVITGLLTAVISGAAVWVWQRGKGARRSRRTAAFFGLRSGRECLVVINHHWNSPRAIARRDVYALVDVGNLVEQVGSRVELRSADELLEGIGDRTEFCIGGPDTNARTAAHLASFLPGVVVRSYADVKQWVEIVAGDRKFVRKPDQLEYALVAKFTAPNANHPVFLICGQTAITNQAAIHFLRHRHHDLARTLTSTDRFCVVVRVREPGVYGHELVDLEADITAAAFDPASGSEPVTGGSRELP